MADSHQTLLYAGPSVAVLVGQLLNSLFGWVWADPLAALVIATFAVREGREAKKCDACGTAAAVAWGTSALNRDPSGERSIGVARSDAPTERHLGTRRLPLDGRRSGGRAGRWGVVRCVVDPGRRR